VTDLEVFFRRIVTNLAAIDPRRLQEPVPLHEIQLSIVPYRTNRRALQVDTSEEYEMVLLRLCSGEGEYVRTDPEEVRLKFLEEAQSTNPDLDVINKFEDVTLTLRPDRVDRALHRPAEEVDPVHVPRPEDPWPDEEDLEEPAPAPAPEPEPSDRPLFDAAEEIIEEAVPVSQCVYCGGALPDRPIRFCPHCGQSQVAMVCPNCQADVEPGWRHCVNCGVVLGSR
jgi:hypothetical protein